jgi:hypothetical protein
VRNSLRVAFIGLLALVAIGWLMNQLQQPHNSGAAPDSDVTKTVTLVVDFGERSRKPIFNQDLAGVSSTATGWDVFKAALLPVAGTGEFPTGFVCRISDWPTSAEQDCADTPQFNEGHWSYFVTNPNLGPGWVISGQGASAHKPDCGGYEGWSWVEPGQTPKPPRFETTRRGCK